MIELRRVALLQDIAYEVVSDPVLQLSDKHKYILSTTKTPLSKLTVLALDLQLDAHPYKTDPVDVTVYLLKERKLDQFTWELIVTFEIEIPTSSPYIPRPHPYI